MSWFGKLLDSTILFSFDRSGYLRHCPKPLPLADLKGLRGIVTGASSGIGLALSKTLLQQRMTLTTTGRDLNKLEERIGSLGSSSFASCLALDLSNLQEVIHFCEKQIDSPLQLLVHNAGDMPSSLKITEEGYEHVFASQVLAPFILTRRLADRGMLEKGCKVIFVSSGGMYLKKLDLSDLLFNNSPYNKYTAYANAKRSQVILNQLFAKNLPHLLFSAMHPGWVDTEGVAASMPLFRKILKDRLRTPEEGADTILWLAMETGYPTGNFWFDRKQAPTSILPWTEPAENEKEALWNLCEEALSRFEV